MDAYLANVSFKRRSLRHSLRKRPIKIGRFIFGLIGRFFNERLQTGRFLNERLLIGRFVRARLMACDELVFV